ncbi:MAG: CPBP family intramembrane glutamic endopeptidase [Pirellulaceae bacterium]|nr:CPBP family intramembrane metalloprotease [Planctomycetales bacterium]
MSHSNDADARSTISAGQRPYLLGLLLVALVLPSFVTWLYFAVLRDAPAAAQLGMAGGGKLLQFALPLICLWGLQRQRLQWRSPQHTGVLLALVFGAAVGGVMLLIYHGWLKSSPSFTWPAEQIQAKIAGMHLAGTGSYIALSVFYSLVHSFLEEYYWRWFIFDRLKIFVDPLWAVVISSVGFMAHHVIVLGQYFGLASWETWFFSVSVAVGGAVWAWIYHRSGNLWATWGSHALVDAAIFLIGYDVMKMTIST